jgi:hypothetical protein
MKSVIPTALLALILLLSQTPIAPAQTSTSGQAAKAAPAQDWQGLGELKSGKKILVEFKTGNTTSGKFISVTGSRLMLSDDFDSYVIEQRDIQYVYIFKGGWSRGRAARIGGVIGFLAGGIIGGEKMSKLERDTSRTPSDKDEIPLIAGMSIGTIAGVGAGALFGSNRKGKLLYEAR